MLSGVAAVRLGPSQVDLCPADGIAILLGLLLATLDLQSGHNNFTLNNLIATFIAIDVFQLVGLQSYRTAAVRPSLAHLTSARASNVHSGVSNVHLGASNAPLGASNVHLTAPSP